MYNFKYLSLQVVVFIFFPLNFVFAQSGVVNCAIGKLEPGNLIIDVLDSSVKVSASVSDDSKACTGKRLDFFFDYYLDNDNSNTKLQKTITRSQDNGVYSVSSVVSFDELRNKFGDNGRDYEVQLTVADNDEEVPLVNDTFSLPVSNNDSPGLGDGGNDDTGNNNTGNNTNTNNNNNNTNTNSSNNNTNNTKSPSGGGSTSLDNPIGYNSLVDLFFAVMRYMLLVIGALTVAVIIYGGFQMVLSRGNESAITEAKRTLTYAIAGLLVAVLAFSIVGIIQNIIGVK